MSPKSNTSSLCGADLTTPSKRFCRLVALAAALPLPSPPSLPLSPSLLVSPSSDDEEELEELEEEPSESFVSSPLPSALAAS